MDDARAVAFQLNIESTHTYSMVPIGDWILSSAGTIEEFAHWRQANMNSFFVQFRSTPEKTRKYLTNFSLSESNRLLFAIMDDQLDIVGHLGVSNCSEFHCEIDNVMKSTRPGLPVGLMSAALTALNDWLIAKTPDTNITLRVRSENTRAIKMYERCGYQIVTTYPVHPVKINEEIHWLERTDRTIISSSSGVIMEYQPARN